MGGPRFCLFGFAGSFASSVLGRLGRQLFSGLCQAAPDKAVSSHFSPGSGRLGLLVQRDFELANRYRRNPGGEADCAVYRSGCGSDASSEAVEFGQVPFQDVALPGARGFDDDRVVLALLENRRSAEVGPLADRPWSCGVSGLDLGKETMAFCKLPAGS